MQAFFNPINPGHPLTESFPAFFVPKGASDLDTEFNTGLDFARIRAIHSLYDNEIHPNYDHFTVLRQIFKRENTSAMYRHMVSHQFLLHKMFKHPVHQSTWETLGFYDIADIPAAKRVKVEATDDRAPPKLEYTAVCNESDGRQTEGLNHDTVRSLSCSSFSEFVYNVNDGSDQAPRKINSQIEWPGDTLDDKTLAPREQIFNEIAEEDIGPDFNFPDLSNNEPDAYRVAFQSKDHPQEIVECVNLHPPLQNPRKIENKTIILQLGRNLTKIQRRTILELAAEFVGIFIRPPGKWAPAKVPPHHIETGNAPPIVTYRKVPLGQRNLVEEELTQMLKKGIISKARSPYINPIVLVKKKTAPYPNADSATPPKPKYRFCIDLRMLNKQILPYVERGGIPQIKDVLDSLRGSQFYSSLDLQSAFWAIDLTEESRDRTAFTSYYKGVIQQMRFNRMPFGLVSASFVMQNALNYTFRGLTPHCASVYIDDCVIPGRTFEEHILNLRKVFERLLEHRFFLQPSKLSLGQEELEILGFSVSSRGIEVLKRKTDAICKIPAPKNKKEMQTFLGLVNFYASYLGSDRSTILSCLYDLTKDKPFEWTDEHQKSFDEVKKRLTSPPVFAFPDPNSEMIVAVDASNLGVGGVLQQKDENGNLRIIATTSRKLTEQQTKAWTVAEKELFSIVHCVQAFDYYLRGQRFRVLTDHKLLANLNFLLKWDRPGRLLRWRLLLQGVDMIVESVKGTENGPADALSRFPMDATAEYEKIGSVSFVVPISMPDAEELRAAQLADPFYSRVINRLKGNPQPDADVNELLANNGKYELHKVNSLLVFSNKNGAKLTVIPQKLRWRVFSYFHHTAGHMAAKKSLSIARRRVHWPFMATDVFDMYQKCSICQRGKFTPNQRFGRLQLWSATRPNSSVGIDCFGELPLTPRGNKVILVIYDRFTRYCSYIPMPNQQSDTIARTFFTHWISRFGMPECILHDNYSSLVSLSKNLWHLLGIKTKRISAGMASTNGATESANKKLAFYLRSWVDQDSQDDWDLYCDAISFASRVTVVQATGYAPHDLMHTFPARLPTDLLYGRSEERYKTAKEYAQQTAKMVKHALKSAKEAQEVADFKKKEQFDKRKVDHFFEKGDLVSIYRPRGKEGLSYKLTVKNSGPYTVVKRLSDVHYRVKPGVRNEPFQTVHIRQLMRYYPEPVSSDSESDSDESSAESDSSKSRINSHDSKENNNQSPVLRDSQDYNKEKGNSEIPDNAKPTIIDEKPNPSGDGLLFLLRTGTDQFWVSREEVSADIMQTYENNRRSRRAQHRRSRRKS